MSLERVPQVDAFNCARDVEPGSGPISWFSTALQDTDVGQGSTRLLLRTTRFDEMAVEFTYADGYIARDRVKRAQFKTSWRVGGQLAFDAPARASRLVRVSLGFRNLAASDLLHVVIGPADRVDQNSSLLAALAGAALAFLSLGFLYNLGLAIASRRATVAWHAAWAGCVLVWGLIWSQLVLLLVPSIGGTAAAEIATALSALAVAFAATCAVTSVARDVPATLRWLALTSGWTTAAIGIAHPVLGSGVVETTGRLLGFTIPICLVLVSACLAIAVRHRSTIARSVIAAWLVPMAVLGLTHAMDLSTALFGGGSYVIVLSACGLQTAWLAVAFTRDIATIRKDGEDARRLAAEQAWLASHDPLTGLLNRRGMQQRLEAMPGVRYGLVLIDVDHFKRINDELGHDVGDDVLVRLGQALQRLAGSVGLVARLGGEEFALAIPGATRAALQTGADEAHQKLGSLELQDLLGPDRTLSVSVGAALFEGDFRTTYVRADRALYAAKRGGRDRVTIAPDGLAEVPAGELGAQIDP